jgi:hypothetical protein
VYLAGVTRSEHGIASSAAHQPNYAGGGYDTFLAKFNGDGELQWGTYFGGSAGEGRGLCAVDSFGNAYLAGSSGSGDGIATAGAHQKFALEKVMLF